MLGSAIAQARREFGITQRQLAAASGVGLETLRKLEQGHVEQPGVFRIAAIADALETTVDALLLRVILPYALLAPIATVMAAAEMAASQVAVPEVAAGGPSESAAVRLRDGLAARLELRGDELVLSSRLGVQPVEAAHEGALRSLLAGETLAVAQLGVAETQHLLRAGVVVLAPIPGVSMPGG